MTLSPAEWTALVLSLQVAAVSVAASLPFALFIAYALARWQFPGKSLLNTLVHAPLVLPPVVTGYALLIVFGQRSPVGSFLAENFGLVFSFRWTGAALASAVMAFPLVVRAIRLSIEGIDRQITQSAAGLGAPPWTVFTRITVPLAMPGIIAGAVLGFAKSIGEFGATITFVSNIPGETQTLPSAIYTFTQVPGGDPQVWRLSLIAVAISFAALAASEYLARRTQASIRAA